MLRFDDITLTQFKNYKSGTFKFKERIIGICGLNGQGKTNLLDAIYYLCFTRSYFSRNEGQNTQFNSEGFRLEGNLTDDFSKKHNIVCVCRSGAKKELIHNESAYEKFSMHIGKFPCVMVAPDDVELISGSSEGRRKFMDTIISQMDANYLQQLIVYNKVLIQRNSLLKRFSDQGFSDWTLLEVLDDQLMAAGVELYEKRELFTNDLIPLVNRFYRQIAANKETITVSYDSQLRDHTFRNLLFESRDKDLLLQRTSTGIHKDDLGTQLDSRPFKNNASQGQRKSLLFAFKLAEFELLKQNKGFAPILLLDDVFEKLDEIRMSNLIAWVHENSKGQVFITDTHFERLVSSLKTLGAVQIIQLN